MAKKKTINWRDIGLVTLAAFAWSKLGVGETVMDLADVARTTPLKSDGTCPAGWVKLQNRCVRL